MRAEDILWGGSNKCGIILFADIGLPEGALLDLEYDYIQERYILKYNGNSTEITTEGGSQYVLDNIYLSGKKPATIVRVIDKDDLTYIIVLYHIPYL